MAKPELEFFRPDNIPWRPVAEAAGTEEKVLSQDPETGDYTRLLRFIPGAETVDQGVLRHTFWEEVWIIEGSLHDLRLDKVFSAGMYACRPPGMPHGPWRSPEGCTTFEIRTHKKRTDESE